MAKKALITGINGQDGSYLAELLLSLGYEVYGLVRPAALENAERRLWRIGDILDRVTLFPSDIENRESVFNIISLHEFDECYHLAAQSDVAASFADLFSTMNTNIQGTLHVLTALCELQPGCRFFFAASGAMFGKTSDVPQRETTPFHPRNPYGISKVAGFQFTSHFREARGMFAASAIMFNHESPRRGLGFVTRKITSAAARIKLGLESELLLGDLDAQRDWGHAKDYVRAMHMMMQQAEPADFVLATGEAHSVREFCELAFAEVGLDYRDYVRVDERYLRPSEASLLVGDASHARERLGWQPLYTFQELIREMVHADLDVAAGAAETTLAAQRN